MTADLDSGRRRPMTTVLDILRTRIDHATFDAAIFSLESVLADMGYGDLRPLPGTIAWIDVLRSEGKSIAVDYSGNQAEEPLVLAGVRERVDVIVCGPRTAQTLGRVLEQLDVRAARAVVVDVAPDGMAAAKQAGAHLAIALARGAATPEQLRRGGADAVVADMQELIGPLAG
jgi:beta-phosphoglucomutase-like phosphatase (HAD superfamily)